MSTGKSSNKQKISASTSRFKRHHRFTLVELLVVIAIISILAGMLLPALSMARSQALTIACMSRQKQTGLLLNTYSSDFNGWIPSFSKAIVAGDSWGYALFLSGYAEDPQVVNCPVYLPGPWNQKMYLKVYGPGHKWVWRNSYGMNSAYNTLPGIINLERASCRTIISWGNPVLGPTVKISGGPSSYPVLADSVRSLAYGDGWREDYRLNLGNWNGHVHMRHLERANVWFLDNHVASLSTDGFYNLPAHGGSIPFATLEYKLP